MRRAAGILLAGAVLAGCSGGADPAPVVATGPAPTSTAAPAPVPAATPAAPLTAAEQRTLASLRVLDDRHPLYEMTYSGTLPALLPARAPDPVASPSGFRKPFGCTVLLAGDPARPVVGRNFDWDPNPALVLHTDPAGGTATVSVVDISYLGYPLARLGELDTPAGRRALLKAPLLPFDGMNEHGLAVGMAAEESAVAARRPGRTLVGSVRVMRLALEQARTVRQAIDVLGRYDVDFDGGPPLHYFVADATGDSAIVEWVGGKFTVIPRGSQPWQVMVNFQQATSTAASRQADNRWRTATAKLTAARGRLSPAGVLGVLKDVRQGHTQWSVAYDLKARQAHLTAGQDYGRVHRFDVG